MKRWWLIGGWLHLMWGRAHTVIVAALPAGRASLIPPLATQKALAQQAYDFWRNPGPTWPGGSHYLAISMVAMIAGECSFEYNALGDKDTAFGIIQWHGDRQQVILKGCGIDVRSASYTDQLSAAAWELQNPEKLALSMLQKAQTVVDAVTAGVVYYERPASPASDITKRGALAIYWASNLMTRQ